MMGTRGTRARGGLREAVYQCARRLPILDKSDKAAHRPVARLGPNNNCNTHSRCQWRRTAEISIN